MFCFTAPSPRHRSRAMGKQDNSEYIGFTVTAVARPWASP